MRFAHISLLSSIAVAFSVAAMVTAQEAQPQKKSASAAPDPVEAAPDKYKVKLDNDRVRVLEVTLPSGGQSPMHGHPDYIVYTLSGGKVRFTSADGKSQEVEFKEGESMFRAAESHSVENIGGTAMRVLNIELKTSGDAHLAAGTSGDAAVPAAAAAHQHEHVVFTPEQQKWQAGPPGLPRGAEMMLMEGDPSKPSPFTMRFKLPANYTIPPHWHPADEHVTVISGTLYMGSGETFDESKAKALPAGSFTVMPKQMRHFAYAEEPVIGQLHGVGPWDIIYINEKDDPRRK